MMKKSIHSPELRVVVRLLAETRQSANLLQKELAQRLAKSPSYVSRVEAGETVLDFLEVRQYVRALDITLPEFVAMVEERLNKLP